MDEDKAIMELRSMMKWLDKAMDEGDCAGMGTFQVAIQVGDLQGRRLVSLSALMDTGASDTVIPASALRELGATVQTRWPFTLADDRTVEYEIGQATIKIDGETRTVPVVFGDSSEATLGASTLEVFHLGVDPVRKRLMPVPGLLRWRAR